MRRLLEGSLRGRFAEETWNKMLRDGVVRDHLNGVEGWDLEDLKQYAKEALESQRRLERELREKWGMSEEPKDEASGDDSDDSKTESVRPVFDIELPEREQRRAAVLLEIQMRQAAEYPGVESFRRERLGGRLLPASEAETYFTPHPGEAISDGELADLGQRLKECYGWHRDEAAWFVLTGELPTARPLGVSFFRSQSWYGPSYGEITLRAAPWVPAKEVKKAFERMRDQVRDGLGPGTVGLHRLELLRFVEEEHAVRGGRIGGPTLLEMWNQEYPHWSYGDYRALLKAYREARQEVIYPKYHSPRRAKSPNMERQETRNRKWIDQIAKRFKSAGAPVPNKEIPDV